MIEDLRLSPWEKLAIVASFLFALAMMVAIFGPIVLVFWKFAFWCFS